MDTMASHPLNKDEAGVIADAAMPLLGIATEPAWRDAVVANIQATAAAARLFLDFPLDDDVEPAPVFRA